MVSNELYAETYSEKVFRSMSGSRSYCDNAMAESFFMMLKMEAF